MPLFALLGLDHNRFGGIINRFTSGDPTVVNADLNGIADLINIEATRCTIMGDSDGVQHVPSANRAQGNNTNNTNNNNNNTNNERPSPSPASILVRDYPPPGVKWGVVRKCHTGASQCPYCFLDDASYWEVGCPCLLRMDKIVIVNAAKGKALAEKSNEH